MSAVFLVLAKRLIAGIEMLGAKEKESLGVAMGRYANV